MAARNRAADSDRLRMKPGSQARRAPISICAETMISGRPRMAEAPGGAGMRLSPAKSTTKAARLRSPSASRIAATDTGPLASRASWAKSSDRRRGRRWRGVATVTVSA